MKELLFITAQKIASDKGPNTALICCSVLKHAFILEGLSEKQANTMAIDAIKIIMKTMLKLN